MTRAKPKRAPVPAPEPPEPAEELEELEAAALEELEADVEAAGLTTPTPAPPISAELAREFAALPAETRVELEELEARSVAYERAASALGTRVRYRSAWQSFAGWCLARGLLALPAHADVVRLYLLSLEEQGRSLSHLAVSLAAIRKAHELARQLSPQSERLSTVLRALRRKLGPKATPARAITVEELRALLAGVSRDESLPTRRRLSATRDRALLLVLYLAGLRRSELCALDMADARRTGEGYTLTIRSSKTDQTGESEPVGLPLLETAELCPVRALDAWLEARASLGRASDGPLFPSLQSVRRGQAWRPLDGRDVDRLLKRAARAAGLDPRQYRPHGLRAGLATEASRRGASLPELQAHLRHRSLETTLGYVRQGAALGPLNPARVIR